MAHAALGLVIGGGLGNVYDPPALRMRAGTPAPPPRREVPLRLKLMDREGNVWPYVSNIADLLLLVGIGMLLVFLWRRDAAPDAKAADPALAASTPAA